MNIQFWRSINAYDSVLDMIENGYKITLLKYIYIFFFKNNRSAIKKIRIVPEAILYVLDTGRVRETFSPPLHSTLCLCQKMLLVRRGCL